MRRTMIWIGALVLASGGMLAWRGAAGVVEADTATLTVYKSPTCGCCEAWIDHMKAAGFKIKVKDQTSRGLAAVKAEHGISSALASCHTGGVNGYVVEGHVPADLVQQMLRDHLPIAGLVVPGMPARSPGMDYPIGPTYEVLALGADGSTQIYARR